MRPPQNAGGFHEHRPRLEAEVAASMRPPQNAGDSDLEAAYAAYFDALQ